MIQKKYFGLIGVTALLLLAAACSPVQNSAGNANINVDSLLASKRFVFIPINAIPLGGRTRQLTNDFAITISPDTVRSYLPYFGRSFTAPPPGGRGPMDFTLTDFEYISSKPEANKWEININPRSNNDIRQLQFIITGRNATLQALSNNRQSITYYGYLQGK